MKKEHNLIIITCILAFCSMVYELTLAQALSAFLENTILRYSVTIGLYMFSMGIGSLLAEGKITQKPVLNLLRMEILLTVFGGLSVVFLFALSYLNPSRLIFNCFAHGLIILIGVLTGFEIPLLIVIANKERDNSENVILAWDYVGAFLGTVIFAFYFYPYLGLVQTSFFIGVLNAISGLVFCFYPVGSPSERKSVSFAVNRTILIFVFVLIAVCLIFSNSISDYLIAQYIY